jgi:predicted metal-binding transcription factor (methanogenesis marker protein 9)
MGPIDHLKFCSARGQLLNIMNTATKDYANAANALATKMGRMSQADYERVRAEVEEARLDAEHARNALLEHRREHGC